MSCCSNNADGGIEKPLNSTVKNSNTRILITGAGGQIGTELVPFLQAKFGKNNVIATDIKRLSDNFVECIFLYGDVTDRNAMDRIVVDYKITWIYHLASLLSFVGEQNPDLAKKINIGGTDVMLSIAKEHKCRIFIPSSIGVFGTSTPPDKTPNTTIMRPSTMYGISKIYTELIGEYYASRYNVDFRSLRYPGVISSEAPAGGGTTDYAVDIYYKAILNGKYNCFLTPNTYLPMLYMPDCLKATLEIMEIPPEKLTTRVYNVTAMSFTPPEITESIKKHIPNFSIDYQVNEMRQAIADSWPNSLDDSLASKDWNWKPEFDLEKMTADMISKLTVKLKDKK